MQFFNISICLAVSAFVSKLLLPQWHAIELIHITGNYRRRGFNYLFPIINIIAGKKLFINLMKGLK